MTRMIAAVLSVIVLILLGMLVLGPTAFLTNIRVVNNSGKTLTNVVIRYGTLTDKLGTVTTSSELRSKKIFLKREEGSALISFDKDGKHFEFDSCYFTYGMPARGTVTITSGGVVQNCST